MHIHILTPSSCIDAELIQRSKLALEQHHIDVSFAAHLFTQHRYLAGTMAERIEDLHTASQNTKIDAIWCGRGGTGSAQLLPFLNMNFFNKPLIGYSDSTTLLNYIAKHGGEAIHGAVFQEIGNKNLDKNSLSEDGQAVIHLLENPQQKQHYAIQPANHIAKKTEMIQGQILGGNLCTLASLQGTDGALTLTQPTILMLEDVGESYYRLERYLIQILQSIDITKLSAVVLGDFYQCEQANVPHTLLEIFAEHLDPLNIPLYQCDWFGHGKKNRPFWIGRQGNILTYSLII